MSMFYILLQNAVQIFLLGKKGIFSQDFHDLLPFLLKK